MEYLLYIFLYFFAVLIALIFGVSFNIYGLLKGTKEAFKLISFFIFHPIKFYKEIKKYS